MLLVIVACISIFFDTWQSIVTTWVHSSTFNHCFFVVPISLWLIWQQRQRYLHLQPSISLLAIAAILAIGLLWLSAELSNVLIIKQFTVVALLLCGIWGVLGNTVALNLAFPLGFLFLMVPVGEELVPPLVNFTASFTVDMIRLTGIPVYREGNMLTLTTGQWSVVKECSGINYLIASITLGLVYAYLNYASYWKRAAFILVSCIVPIIANGMRAFMIVMIGHLSNMTLAVGVDHIIYGAVFFGAVILTVFYIGSFWRDTPFTAININTDNDGYIYNAKHIYGILILITASFLIWPYSSNKLINQQSNNLQADQITIIQPQDWQSSDSVQMQWQPDFKAATNRQTAYFSKGDAIIGLHIASFGNESQGHELVNSENRLIPNHGDGWHVASSSTATMNIGDKSIAVNKTLLGNTDNYFLVFDWYQIGMEATANPYKAKLLQLLKRLSGQQSSEFKIVLWTTANSGQVTQGIDAHLLQDFSTTWLPQQQPLNGN